MVRVCVLMLSLSLFFAQAGQQIMDEKLEKTGTYSVSSTDGFVVELQQFGVLYHDASGESVIGYSWLGRPSGITLHPGTLSAHGLDQARIDLIIPRAVRALESVGWHVELLAGPTTVRFWLRAASSSCPP